MSKRCSDCKTTSISTSPYCEACGKPFPRDFQPDKLSEWQYAVLWFLVAVAPVLFEHFVLGWK